MAEHPLRSRVLDVPADEWSDEHQALAEQVMRMGLPQPTKATWVELTTYVDDVDGAPLMVEQSRSASVGNC